MSLLPDDPKPARTKTVWLVCGGRDLHRKETWSRLDTALKELGPPDLVIHSGAIGADSHADSWARTKGIHVAVVDALWDNYKKAAGPIRNSAMLLLRPDVVVALPGHRGTADMVKKSVSAGVRVLKIP
jgi:hypothetical protein